MSRKKRGLALILAISMVLSIFNISAFAEDTQGTHKTVNAFETYAYSSKSWEWYPEYEASIANLPPVEEVANYTRDSAEFEALNEKLQALEEIIAKIKTFKDSMKLRETYEKDLPLLLEEQKERYTEGLDEKLENGEITQEQYDQYQEEIENELKQSEEMYESQIDDYIQMWNDNGDTTFNDEIVKPFETLKEKYKWYEDSFATAETVTRPDSVSIELSDSNDRFKTPEYFSIGKPGTKYFSIKVTYDIDALGEYKNAQNKALVVTLPDGFSFMADTYSSHAGETYFYTPSSDNVYKELNIDFSKSNLNAGKFTQTFRIEQDAQKVINSLPKSKGNIDFKVNLFANYRTADQVKILSGEDDDDSAVMELKADNTKADITMTVETGTEDDVWTTYDISPKERYGTRFSYSGALSTNTIQVKEKPFKFKITKTKGYLTDDVTIIPNVPMDILNGLKYRVSYIGKDDNKCYVNLIEAEGNVYDYDDKDLKINLMFAAASNHGYDDFDYFDYETDNHAANTVSYADVLYEAGTYELTLAPSVYINQIYDGDWNKVSHVGKDKAKFEYIDIQNNSKAVTEADTPLHFKLENGKRFDDFIGSIALPEKTPQYGTNPNYADMGAVTVKGYITDPDKEFAFYDDFTLTYDFKPDFYPVEITNMQNDSDNDFSYRIYVTDPVNNTKRIETYIGYTRASEEGIEDGKTVTRADGIVETFHIGNSYVFDGNANKEYISKVEVYKAQYEFNELFTLGEDEVFDAVFRARRADFSGNAYGDNHQVVFTSTLSAKQDNLNEGAKFEPITTEYKIKTVYLFDDIQLVEGKNDGCEKFIMEVNSHNETANCFDYGITKYADSRAYNTDADGNWIKFGDADYNPVVVELSGTGITVADRLKGAYQRVIGIVDENDNYINLVDKKIDAAKYYKDASNCYKVGAEPYASGSNHGNNADYEAFMVTNLKALYDDLGVKYAKKIVVAIENINDYKIPDGAVMATFNYEVGINQLKPGYLNYDEVIGITGPTDEVKQLDYSAVMFCNYKDYLAYKDNKNTAGYQYEDSLGGETGEDNHGPHKVISGKATKVCYGSQIKGFKAVDEKDEYCKPITKSNDYLYDSWYYDEYDSYVGDACADNILAMTEVEVDNSIETTPQIDYKDIVYDFDGTDKDLLALSNIVVFKVPTHTGDMTKLKVDLEYTLSDGTTVKTEEPLFVYGRGYIYYKIPELFDRNNKAVTDKYLTSLKVKFDDELNWGNGGKKRGDSYFDETLPGVGLARRGAFPTKYPVSGNDICDGTEYDNLDFAVKMSYSEFLTDTPHEFSVEGTSRRIEIPTVMVSKADYLYGEVKIPGTNGIGQLTVTEQGSDIDLVSTAYWKVGYDTKNGNSDELTNIKIRPTLYYKIDKNFQFISNSIVAKKGEQGSEIEGVTYKVVKPNGNKGDWYLVVSFENVSPADMIMDKSNYQPEETALKNIAVDFKLKVRYDAETTEQLQVVKEYWMDIPLDRENGYNGMKVISNANQMEAGAPYGDEFLNKDRVVNADEMAGTCDMFKIYSTPELWVQEKRITKVESHVGLTQQDEENDIKVESVGIDEEIFSYLTELTHNNNGIKRKYDYYVVVPKKDGTFSYGNDLSKRATYKNEYSLDYSSINSAELTDERINYTVYYTEDETNYDDYESIKNCNWVQFDPETVSEATKKNIRAIKFDIDVSNAPSRLPVKVNFKLSDPKTEVGDQCAYGGSYYNYEVDGIVVGNAGTRPDKEKKYILKDMEIRGLVWLEKTGDYVYNSESEETLENIKLVAENTNGTEVDSTESNANGKYILRVPSNGNWTVKVVGDSDYALVPTMQLANETVSVFERMTNEVSKGSVNVTLNANIENGITFVNDINAGFVKNPSIEIADQVIKVGETIDNIPVTINNKLQNSELPKVAPVTNESSEYVGYSEEEKDGVKYLSFEGIKEGVVKYVVTIKNSLGDEITKEFTVTVEDKDNNTGSSNGSSEKYYLEFDSNGGTKIDKVSVSKNQNVTLDKYVTKKDGYEFDGWYSDEALENAVSDITIKGNTTVYAKWKKIEDDKDKPVSGLNDSDHYKYILGYPDGNVRPNANITREEATTIFYRLLTPQRRDEIFTNVNGYTDMTRNMWSNKAVSSMSNGKYIYGYDTGDFKPTAPITRAEFAAIASRFMTVNNTAEVNFTDIDNTHWAYKNVATMVENGFISGYPDNTFKPDQAITRAEVMTIINKMLNRKVDESGLIAGCIQWPDNKKNDWYYYEVLEATNDHSYKRNNSSTEKWLNLKVDYTYDVNKYERP